MFLCVWCFACITYVYVVYCFRIDVCSSQYWSNVETVICLVHTSFIFIWKTQLDKFSFPYHVCGDHILCSGLWVEHNGRRSASVWNVALVTLMDILAPVDVYVCVFAKWNWPHQWPLCKLTLGQRWISHCSNAIYKDSVKEINVNMCQHS